MGRIILVGGGARSGKSAFALSAATHLGDRRLFIATATAGDEEMSSRIARHQEERGDAFVTREEPTKLARAIEEAASFDVVLVDCLTFWISNLLFADLEDDAIEGRVAQLAKTLEAAEPHVVMVSNEVGLGLVPEHPLGRRFRDLVGRAHRCLAANADEVYLGAMGMMLRLKPGPVQAMEAGQWP
ncbi:MAG: bifunctional adenosylcobinamide kinase/adenosylcobinamide-phosphate guanylyltransferase [Myxococcota bacterium]